MKVGAGFTSGPSAESQRLSPSFYLLPTPSVAKPSEPHKVDTYIHFLPLV